MKKALMIFFSALLSLSALGQVTIQNDSLFINGIPSGEYGLLSATNSETIIQIKIFNPELTSGTFLTSATKSEFEQLVKVELSNRPFIKSDKFYFQYSFELEGLTTAGKAGVLIEEAGRAYNGALVVGFLGSAGGTALFLAGIPVFGAVVSIGGAFVTLILQVRGNNKLIEGGKGLQTK